MRRRKDRRFISPVARIIGGKGVGRERKSFSLTASFPAAHEVDHTPPELQWRDTRIPRILSVVHFDNDPVARCRLRNVDDEKRHVDTPGSRLRPSCPPLEPSRTVGMDGGTPRTVRRRSHIAGSPSARTRPTVDPPPASSLILSAAPARWQCISFGFPRPPLLTFRPHNRSYLRRPRGSPRRRRARRARRGKTEFATDEHGWTRIRQIQSSSYLCASAFICGEFSPSSSASSAPRR